MRLPHRLPATGLAAAVDAGAVVASVLPPPGSPASRVSERRPGPAVAGTGLGGTFCPTPSWLLAGTLEMCGLPGLAGWPGVTPRLGQRAGALPRRTGEQHEHR